MGICDEMVGWKVARKRKKNNDIVAQVDTLECKLHHKRVTWHESDQAEITNGQVVSVGISATWNVLSWSEGRVFES